MSVRRSLVVFACLFASVAASGCSMWDATKRFTRLKGDDMRDTTEDSQEQWEIVGDEGRRGQAVEKDPDQWWRQYVMSEKARSIEENLGFE